MKISSIKRLFLPLFLVCMAILPVGLNPANLAIACTFLIFASVALSQDIILGKAGMFNMGQSMFFGLGAYITAILNVHPDIQMPILATIPFAAVGCALVAGIVSAPITHLRGDYLLVVTIGLNIVFVQVLQNLEITGGANGLFGLEELSLTLFGYAFDSAILAYALALFVLILTLVVMHNLEHSKTGRALHYLREDYIAAKSMGINPAKYKIFAFMLGAGIAGIAGSVFSVQFTAVSPEAFKFQDSILLFSIIIVGGSSIPGVLAGVFLMFILPQIITSLEIWRYFVFGLAMVVTMILRPRGLWPATFGKLPSYMLSDRRKDD